MIEFYTGLASMKKVTQFHNLICLAGAPINQTTYDTPFLSPVKYIVDSPAFYHMGKGRRITNQSALEDQLKIIEIAKCPPFAVSTYDDLVDEKLIEGRLTKIRVTAEESLSRVRNTIESARFYATQRVYLKSRIIFAAQGISLTQYTNCILDLLPFVQQGDIIGYGGFCILGQRKSYIPEALQIFQNTLPLIAQVTDRVHIYGVTTFDILYILGQMCERLSLTLSVDSTSCIRWARHGEYITYKGKFERINSKVYTAKTSEFLAIWNVLMVQYILNDIKNRYVYKGKKGWLSAIDFAYTQLVPSLNWD